MLKTRASTTPNSARATATQGWRRLQARSPATESAIRGQYATARTRASRSTSSTTPLRLARPTTGRSTAAARFIKALETPRVQSRGRLYARSCGGRRVSPQLAHQYQHQNRARQISWPASWRCSSRRLAIRGTTSGGAVGLRNHSTSCSCRRSGHQQRQVRALPRRWIPIGNRVEEGVAGAGQELLGF